MPSAKATGLSGKVLEQKTDRPLSGLVVEAVNEKGASIKGIQTSVVDATGAFELRFDQPDDKAVATALKSGIILRITTAAGSEVHSTDKIIVKAGTDQIGTIELPSQSVSQRTATENRGTFIRVSVHLPGGVHYDKNVTVSLRQRSKSTTVKRVKGSLLYEAQVEPGVYQLEVSAGSFTSPGRTVTVPREGKTVSLYLGEKDWPFYRLGENIVPFEPREDLFAVVFPSNPPDEKTARELVQKLTSSLPLKPFEFNSTTDNQAASSRAANGAIWLFSITRKSDAKMYAQLLEAVRRILGEEVRAGIPVDIKPGQVKVLDNQFVVRFRDHLKPAEIERLAKEAGARILRGFIQAGNARLLEFTRGWYRDYLAVIEKWYKEDLLVYGEPDLLAEFTDDVFPADPPNDALFGTQANLTLQGANAAWQFLNGINPNLTLGSPNVFVGTLDRGVDTDHPDIVGNLTDGTPQLARCFDFSGMRPCTAPGYAPDTSHGMGVYGIISARTNNGTAIAGIAPNVHHIGIERPDVLSVNYPDVLLWMAGFTTGNITPNWPAEPISPAADIISCSHGSGGTALSGIMDDTLTYLATYGRGGRGTLIIYSSGNDNMLITGWRTWAAHPRTMAIGNSMQPDGMGVERRDNTSNFGPELDICAQGTNAPSLNPTGGTQVFGGTSAAAPTVNAAAALMLSVEPALTWINLRDILRNTAVVIDPANANPVGQWIGGFSQWYGFGRLNINAAVQGANAFDPGSVNLVVRDNMADDGTFVPTAGTFWRSPDLWVRNSDPVGDPALAYNANPPNDPATFGSNNWVRVRVKNVGSAPSSNFWVRAYLTHFAGSQFRYPANYIPSINTGDPIPSPLVQGTYLIGEQFVNSLGAGADDIYTFPWPAALVPPEIVNGTHWHPCLLAEVSPHTGPTPSGNLVTDNTNLAQRNITISYSDDDNVHEMTGVIGHADDDTKIKRITVYRGNLPKNAKLWVRLPDTRVEEAAIRLQRTKGNTQKTPVKTDCCCGTSNPPHKPTTDESAEKIAIDRIRGYRVFRLASGDRLTLDIPMVSGRLTPIVVGAWMSDETEKQSYEIALTEQDGHGHALGGFSLVIKPRG